MELEMARRFRMFRSFRILQMSKVLRTLGTSGALMPPSRQPRPEASERARTALKTLRPGKGSSPSVSVRTAKGKKVSVELPAEAFQSLMEVLEQLAQGNAVTVVPLHAELTTQQAADFLNVSRPFLVGLLESRTIPCRRVGTHRRVRVADLLAFKERDDSARRQVADELAAEAQGLGLGY